jgi:hypothetical protein
MATTKAVLIPFDESKPVEVIDLGRGLDAIYERVAPESRMFEVTRGNTFDLLGDEEGGPLMRSDASERINARAMQIYASDKLMSLRDYTSPLCGDFLAVGIPDEEGEHTDVPQHVIDYRYSWTAVRPGA